MTWQCKICGVKNSGVMQVCVNCGAQREGVMGNGNR